MCEPAPAVRRWSRKRAVVVAIMMATAVITSDSKIHHVALVDNIRRMFNACPMSSNFSCGDIAEINCRYNRWCATRPLLMALTLHLAFSAVHKFYTGTTASRKTIPHMKLEAPVHNFEERKARDFSMPAQTTIGQVTRKRAHSEISVDDETVTVAPTSFAAQAAHIKISTPPSSQIPAPLMPNSIRLHHRRLTGSPSGLARHNKFKIRNRQSLSEISPPQRTPEEQLAGGRYKLRSKAKLTKMQRDVIRRDEEDKKKCLRAEKHEIGGGRRATGRKEDVVD